MDEMYGLPGSCANYYGQQTPAMAPHPRDGYNAPLESPSSLYRDRNPIPGSGGQRFSNNSSSSSASITVQSRRNNTSITTTGSEEDELISDANIRAKIISHPLYPKLLQAYISCQKVGAPPDVADLFDEVFRENDPLGRPVRCSCLGDDPELDEFMESYCEVLMKYKSDLATPFNEATTFLNSIESQLSNLCNAATTSRTSIADEVDGETEEDFSTGYGQVQECSRTSEDRELKEKLLAKYSKYISSLRNEFSNKKKKGKLPGEARQILLDWWNVHYKWPYPTEADKVALAEMTGLDQKQINNWFINQRKRHWKPSENMQFAVIDNLCGPFFANN